ncbi:hypothetical protein QN379_23480, partial [Glaciimonas sp. Gout2]
LLLQTRFKSLIDQIELKVDADGMHLNGFDVIRNTLDQFEPSAQRALVLSKALNNHLLNTPISGQNQRAEITRNKVAA